MLGIEKTLPVGDVVYSGLYWAKDALIVQGVTETVNAGFLGESYANLDNVIGSNITFTVEVPETGNYLMTVRYANASVNNREMKIEVNSGEDYWVQPFLSTVA